MPVILTQDGPSLGGFVCAATIVKAELWKVGQLKPGDKVRFKRISFDDALLLEKAIDQAIETLTPYSIPVIKIDNGDCILASLPETTNRQLVTYRQAGDKYILLEYGPIVLDIRFRLRVYALMEELKANAIEGILELSPGVRSLQIHYDSRIITQHKLIEALLEKEHILSSVADMRIPTRVVYLPMAYEDSATLEAVAKYRQSVRDTAPWLPSNTEFIRRINGLESAEDVKNIIFETSYMVLGLGDVYLGAPCAVPVDPRHRLLTSKYNPARTYTAEGTVGIGGVYMCIYGMDSPGGYQLVGRTLPIWNKFLKNKSFEKDKPWLLRFFDQVRFYPVSEDELTKMREDFREGLINVRIEEEIFDLKEYESFLAENADSIDAFKTKQQAAFETEVALWQNDSDEQNIESNNNASLSVDIEIKGQGVYADISGNIWKLLVTPGQEVKADEPLLIVEAMKMEFTILAETSGTVNEIFCKAGKQVNAGELLLSIE